MDNMTIDEKRQYVERIDNKAKAEGISNKHAARKLGLHEWKYYQFKNDIKRNNAEALSEKPQEKPSGPVKITLMVTEQAYQYLIQEGNDFALDPEIVAQMILHNAIMKGVKNNGKALSHNMGNNDN
ncbi:MAG TPA: hypothetical protein V6C97_27755 [Oculatellaceae cyanobacterium]